MRQQVHTLAWTWPPVHVAAPRMRSAPRCVDLDGDGVIRPREMLHFYEEQLKRLEGWNQEPVQFEDLLCQLHDMLNPAVEGAYTLRWGKMHWSWTWGPSHRYAWPAPVDFCVGVVVCSRLVRCIKVYRVVCAVSLPLPTWLDTRQDLPCGGIAAETVLTRMHNSTVPRQSSGAGQTYPVCRHSPSIDSTWGGCVRLPYRDLKRTKPQSGLLFSALFSLHKFVGFENRDPFAQRAEAAEYAGLSDWDKFAKLEYFRWVSGAKPYGCRGGPLAVTPRT